MRRIYFLVIGVLLIGSSIYGTAILVFGDWRGVGAALSLMVFGFGFLVGYFALAQNLRKKED